MIDNIVSSYKDIHREWKEEMTFIATTRTDYYLQQIFAGLMCVEFVLRMFVMTLFTAFVYVPISLVGMLFGIK